MTKRPIWDPSAIAEAAKEYGVEPVVKKPKILAEETYTAPPSAKVKLTSNEDDGEKERRKLAKDNWPVIVDKFKAGMSMNALAREYGCAASSIRHVLIKAGVVQIAGDDGNKAVQPAAVQTKPAIAETPKPVAVKPTAPVMPTSISNTPAPPWPTRTVSLNTSVTHRSTPVPHPATDSPSLRGSPLAKPATPVVPGQGSAPPISSLLTAAALQANVSLPKSPRDFEPKAKPAESVAKPQATQKDNTRAGYWQNRPHTPSVPQTPSVKPVEVDTPQPDLAIAKPAAEIKPLPSVPKPPQPARHSAMANPQAPKPPTTSAFMPKPMPVEAKTALGLPKTGNVQTGDTKLGGFRDGALIADRLQKAADALMTAWSEWCTTPGNSAIDATLTECLHGLRRSLARIEIEQASARRHAHANNTPLPKPHNRFASPLTDPDDPA